MMVIDQKHPFIVLDQNVMRDSDAISLAMERCRREQLQLLIPDVAGFEFSKGSEPFDTWRRSLEYLRGYPELVSVSRKLTKMLAEERSTGKPCETLVDEVLTMAMRAMLGDFVQEKFGKLTEIIDGPLRQLMPASLAVWSDSEKHQRWIRTILNTVRDTLDGETLRQLRKSPKDGLRKWLSSVDGIRFVFQGIDSCMHNDVSSLCLVRSPSVYAAFISGVAAVAIHWLAYGGLDKATPEKSTNDLLDIEYAVLGSLSVDLASNDKRLSTIYLAMSIAADERQSWFRNRKWNST